MKDLNKFKNEMNLSGHNVYVGHRYVPKIFGEWDNTKIYEPLSIVQYQGASYTSRQYVPVGVELTNEEYWTVTGNYNAQVEQYRQDVRNLQNDFTKFDGITEGLTSDLNSRGVNIETYESEVANDDWTAAIQKTLDTHGHAIVKGRYKVDGTIEVKQNQILELMQDTTIYKSAESNNTDPVVWLKSNYAVLRGVNKRGSIIQSMKETPFGVVCLGYKGMNDVVGKNVLYATISEVGIIGHKNGGNETGVQSVALGLFNPQVSELASYFHTIRTIFIANANIGILFDGWANANIVDDVQFINTGNNKWLNGGALVFRLSSNKEPLDNIISNIFHHQSNNADTLVFENGGMYSTFTNIVSEQGGTLARWVKEFATSTNFARNNIITGISNVASGNNVSADFYKNNSVTNGRTIYTNSIASVKSETDDAKIKTLSLGNDLATKFGSFTMNAPITENTAYKAFDVKMQEYQYYRSYIVEMNVNFYSPISSIRGSQKAIFSIDFGRYENETTVKLLNAVGTKQFIITPIINGYSVAFGFRTGNNGTSTTNTIAYIDYKLSGSKSADVIIPTTNTLIESPVTLATNSNV